MRILDIQNLKKNYGTLEAVKGVSFGVQAGEIFGLLGPNGAGKTTVISSVVTLEKPTSGQIRVLDCDTQVQPRLCKSMTGLVPQEIINHGFFNVEEILVFQSGYYGIRHNRDWLHQLMNKLQLFEHRHKKVKQLSGGMKRRLLIAKALVHKPKLLLLDEPTAGVDVELRKLLWDFVRELKQEGMAILLTTHYLEEAERLCDRVAFIHKGNIIKQGKTLELIRELTSRTVRIMLKHPLGDVRHEGLIGQTKEYIEFRLPSHKGVGDLLLELNLDARSIADMQVREGSLEEAFQLIVAGVIK